jgi:hypothetical protein
MLYDDISASEAIQADYSKDGNLDAYIKLMKSPSTMGGAIEIRAFVNLWKRPVIIYSRPNKRFIEFICNNLNHGAPIKLIWTGGHYSPA